MEIQEQHVEETENDSFKMAMKQHSVFIYDICTKICITNFKSKDLSDKEKLCLGKCFDRKVESFFVSSHTLTNFMEAHQKKQSESQSFTGGFA